MTDVPRTPSGKRLKGCLCRECGERFFGTKGQRYCNDCKARYPESTSTASMVRRSAYGLSFAEEARLMAIKGCEICGSSDNLVIDHDHGSGKVRGRLCWHCNVALGHVRDDVNVLRGMATYLEERSV